MNKIICDICGTAYPDTEAECPICGCAKDVSAAALADELLEQEAAILAAADTGVATKKTPVFEVDDDKEDYDDLYDEFDDYDDDDEEDDDEDDDEEDEDDHKSNAPLVIALVIVILLLIAVSAFILVRFFLPNVVAPEVTGPSVVETTEAPVQTTELKIDCETLALTNGVDKIVLEEEGANWLINVMALPENTTDALIYSSSDESVVTVNEQGKLTAVGEGSAVITITCGEHKLECTVICDFTPEASVPETTVPDTEPEETEPEETEAPEENKPVTGTITANPSLNIRENPDRNSAVKGMYAKGEKVTILEQKTVNGDVWGRTDRGWINMKYVELDD